jgi:hypothetical protein
MAGAEQSKWNSWRPLRSEESSSNPASQWLICRHRGLVAIAGQIQGFGGSVSSDSSDVNDRLSRAFNRAVVLASAAPALEEYWPDIDGLAHHETVTDESIGLGAPPGTFFDFSATHIVTTATLRTLSRAYPHTPEFSVMWRNRTT